VRCCLSFLVRFVRDEDGQDLIEYGLLAGAIAAAGVAVFPGIVTAMSDAFQQWNADINSEWVPPDPVP
jgi:Flp pilus assembly pilin Flp